MPVSYVDENTVFQVCFVTDDLERTARWFSAFFRMDMPAFTMSGPHDEAQTDYRGMPSEARGRMAFFAFGNTTIELIEPDDRPSCWRDFLDRHGPGCHHLAFKVEGMKQKVMALGAGGYGVLQRGEFAGGRYAYVDTEAQLGALIELLEFDGDP